MKVLIVEDELFTAMHLKTAINNNGHQVVGTADCLAQVRGVLTKSQPEVAIVDIRLKNNESGIEVGRLLQKQHIPFFYLTANNELHTVTQAGATEPESYLTKPFKDADVLAALEIIHQKYYQRKVVLKTIQGVEQSFSVSAFLYAKSDNVYVDLYLGAHEHITVRSSLSEMEKLLQPDFERVHRSYLVNKKKITKQTARKLYINNIEIPLSRVK